MGEYTPIRNLKPGQKDMTLMFIVLDVGRPNVTKEGHEVRTVKVADKTGSVNLSLWDEPGKLVQSGDILRMTKGYTNVWKNCLTLYISKNGEINKVGEFCLIFSEIPFMSEPNPELGAIAAQIASDRGTSGGGGNKSFGNRNNGGNNGRDHGHDRSNPDQRSLGGRFPANGGAGANVAKWGHERPPGGHDRGRASSNTAVRSSMKDKQR